MKLVLEWLYNEAKTKLEHMCVRYVKDSTGLMEFYAVNLIIN